MNIIWCAEDLFDDDGFRAVCNREYGTEHSHHDLTAREAVAAGLAAEGCYDCAEAEGDPDRDRCSNCDRDWSRTEPQGDDND